ncbi:antitoxin component YwqK of YwqJK toxin-antitoxin module [Chitinophaga skermanii]|uniref:Antitoxin component YwqK of YwqJK toxin-antitoxin module n=1 Tax=Chitinophaga skermanii TaxID=331697 RepID=A0A327RAH2_9BACT|nr:hypothetical protein [Chitinophaga skermanii]RAJ10917.1 antitoxin component YwqK of YwqJK toxin-antitoxin module [Chitinophaga skermanii]
MQPMKTGLLFGLLCIQACCLFAQYKPDWQSLQLTGNVAHIEERLYQKPTGKPEFDEDDAGFQLCQIGHVDYDFNEAGLAISRTFWNYDGEEFIFPQKWAYTYQQVDTLFLKSLSTTEGKTYEYYYNEEALLVKEFYYEHAALRQADYYMYSTENQLVQKLTQNYTNNKLSKNITTKYTYDKWGMLREKSNTENKYVYRYDANKKLVEEENYLHKKLDLKITYNYNAQGLLREKNNLSADNYVQEYQTFVYNTNGKETLNVLYQLLDRMPVDEIHQETTYDASGKVATTKEMRKSDHQILHRTAYFYDTQGNWVKKLSYDGNNVINMALRKIEYY